MIAALILSSTFFVGFIIGYGARALKSGKRRARYEMYTPYISQAPGTLRRARRAF